MAQYLKIALLSFTNHEGNHQVHKGKDLGRTAVSVARALLPSKSANPPSDPSLPIGRVTKNPPKKTQEKAKIYSFHCHCKGATAEQIGPFPPIRVRLSSLTHSPRTQPGPPTWSPVKRTRSQKRRRWETRNIPPPRLTHKMNEITLEKS